MGIQNSWKFTEWGTAPRRLARTWLFRWAIRTRSRYNPRREYPLPLMALIQPPKRQKSVLMALTNSWWVRLPRTYAVFVNPSRIKAKAFATPERPFAVKPAKLVKSAAKRSRGPIMTFNKIIWRRGRFIAPNADLSALTCRY